MLWTSIAGQARVWLLPRRGLLFPSTVSSLEASHQGYDSGGSNYPSPPGRGVCTCVRYSSSRTSICPFSPVYLAIYSEVCLPQYGLMYLWYPLGYNPMLRYLLLCSNCSNFGDWGLSRWHLCPFDSPPPPPLPILGF